jgi:hypothetical protein
MVYYINRIVVPAPAFTFSTCVGVILGVDERTASDGWENCAVDEYRHITALFLK